MYSRWHLTVSTASLSPLERRRCVSRWHLTVSSAVLSRVSVASDGLYASLSRLTCLQARSRPRYCQSGQEHPFGVV